MKISMRFMALSVIALCAALFAPTAFGQSATTGSIEGTVTDVNGGSVPGITVSIKSPNLIVAQTATTDDSGNFRVLNLPPGKYTVTVESTKGFGKFERTDVDVNLGRTSKVTVQLEPERIGAEVNVTASAGASIDVAGNTTGTSVSTDQFSNFPTSRTVQGLFTIAPTVTRSGLRDAAGRDRDPSVGGSSGPENNYILDGVNTTDPAFGGSGANLPFEFVQEVEIKTGAYGAEYGKATGGIFNVITKSGGNEFHGDLFGYFVPHSFVRGTKNFSFTGSANNGYSEVDAGGDIGGPIIKNKLWFFGAFNPQLRKNFYLTQTLKVPVENRVKTPFYAGKLTWAFNQSNIFTFSTFADFTKVTGFLAVGALNNVSGYGADVPGSFNGRQETGGHNYAFRLNSNLSSTWTGEFLVGLHFQRNNVIPEAGTATPLITDAFSIVRNGAVQPLTQSGILFTPPATGVAQPTLDANGNPVIRFGQAANTLGFIDFVLAPGGSLQRNFVRQGWGLFQNQKRNRFEASAKMQNIFGQHTLKYGGEWYRNVYDISQLSTGPSQTFGNPLGLTFADATNNSLNGFRVTNNFYVCTTRGTVVVCPTGSSTRSKFNFFAAQQLLAAGRLPGFTSVIEDAITQAEFFNNPLLIRSSTRVRDFELVANTYTNVESAYVQDDFKMTHNLTVNLGLRWDYQQAYGNGSVSYIKLNNLLANTQPRVGVVWDFTGKGRGKLFANYGRFIETPIPLDVNVRAGSNDTQTDKNFNTDRAGGVAGSNIVPGISGNWGRGAVNLGASSTPIDQGLRPQSIEEFTGGAEYEVVPNLVLGTRGVYRNYVNVIEDGSFDDGNNYFLFNPGRRANGTTTEDLACADPTIGCFGRARRYYRAVEFSATKRFTNHYQFIASYVFSSLIGNYEGLFRNDNGQSDPNITSLFDLVSLLANTYGRLPNDRPHQFKFNGSYQTPWKLMLSGNFYAQSGVPFNQLIPHPVYGNNEGFGLPRGTAIVPAVPVDPNNPNVVNSIGKNRSPFTWNLDFGAYMPIKVGEGKELRLTADWFNVFNQQRAVTLDQTFTINSGASGVPPVPNPFYGSGIIFQYPSALRLGAKFQF